MIEDFLFPVAAAHAQVAHVARDQWARRGSDTQGRPGREGSSFGDVPLNVELKLEVWDSPNSAGIVIDAVRLAKLALDNGVGGALEGPSAYLMKSPPKQLPDDEARDAVESFIKKYSRKKAKAKA